jgi:hypothetical protein
MSEKNMLKTVTTWARPPRMCPTRAWLRLAMRMTTFAEVMSSPTSKKNGTAINASVSIPLKSWPTIDARVMGVSAVPISTPAISENATGTPI